jgi:hypothetical protein
VTQELTVISTIGGPVILEWGGGPVIVMGGGVGEDGQSPRVVVEQTTSCLFAFCGIVGGDVVQPTS